MTADTLPTINASALPADPFRHLQDWLQLLHITGLSTAIRNALLAALGSPRGVLNASVNELTALGVEPELSQRIVASQRPDSEASLRTRRALEWQQRQSGRHLLLIDDPHYPPLLREIDDPPPLLYVEGNPVALLRPMVAIVGSRNCSPYGLAMASELATDLARAGLVICSGLAHGIDASAHRAAVRAGQATVAVLGNGLHSIYPAGHRPLAEQIVEGGPEQAGALVSELPLDAGPVSSHFPRRNRIISGLSLGVCVVEAVLRSGSLITARLALEQNRNVFAVPGSVNNTRSRGCHRLIREGAMLIENAGDVLSQLETLVAGQRDLLQQQVELTCQAVAPSLPAEFRNVLNLLSDDPVALDELLSRTGMDVTALNQALLMLELEGCAVSQGGRWQRCPQ